ncbi:hypothetical protein Syun_001860 [Stephania yunnanensis]|uniref:Uncharacterized protein n=1 Tax=Stephania yunnanensis TaxID=152371 RepID=A0AAP0Q6W9_9MAGN
MGRFLVLFIHEDLFHLAKSYGPLFGLRMGQRPAIVVSSPKSPRRYLSIGMRPSLSGPSRRPSRTITYGATSLVFVPYGSRWRSLRRCSPPSSSPPEASLALLHKLDSSSVVQVRLRMRTSKGKNRLASQIVVTVRVWISDRGQTLERLGNQTIIEGYHRLRQNIMYYQLGSFIPNLEGQFNNGDEIIDDRCFFDPNEDILPRFMCKSRLDVA